METPKTVVGGPLYLVSISAVTQQQEDMGDVTLLCRRWHWHVVNGCLEVDEAEILHWVRVWSLLVEGGAVGLPRRPGNMSDVQNSLGLRHH